MRLLVGVGVLLLVSACGSGSELPAGQGRNAATAGVTQSYQRLIDFYAAESGSEVDPMVFVPAPRARAGIGPLMVRHVAGIRPAKQATPSTTKLLGADGTPLGITFEQWQQASGTATFRCVDSSERVSSTLSNLIPSGTYSTFAVHTSVQGPRRFTPWGDPDGTTNNFKASADGTASPTNTVQGCSGTADVIIIVWHSDDSTHGRSPGKIGLNWHTSLIARVPPQPAS
jgi:hypothetical protein